MHQRWGIWAAGIGMLGALAGCGSSAAPSKAPGAKAAASSTSAPAALTTVTYKFNSIATAADSPFAYGINSGIYKKYGLNVKWSFGTGSANTTAQVGAGKVQFGNGSLVSVLQLRAQGVPVTAVMGETQMAEAAITVRNDASVSSVQDLSKITIGGSPGSSALLLLPAFEKAAHLNPATIHVDNMAFSAQYASLFTGKVQGLVSFWDQVEAVESNKGLKTHSFKFADYGVDPLNLGLVVNESTIQQNPELVARFVAASQASMIATEKDPMAAVQAMIKDAGSTAPPASVLLAELKSEMPLWQTPNDKGHPVGWMSGKDWQSTEQLTQAYLGMKGSVSLSQVYTNKFLPKS